MVLRQFAKNRDRVGQGILARWRRLVRTGPIYAWRFAGPVPDTICQVPRDFLPGQANNARAIYLGTFTFCGIQVDTGGASPFSLTDTVIGWNIHLHGFSWLRDLAADGNNLAAANARALITDWQTNFSQLMRDLPWDTPIAAERLMSFLRYSNFILQNSNQGFFRKFCAIIVRHERYLRAVVRGMEPSTNRLTASIAVAVSTLCLPRSPSQQRRALQFVQNELEHQILADGFHISRNPDQTFEVLHNLLSLSDCLIALEQVVPDLLGRAIDRMFCALRAMVHQDGTLAAFNGGGTVPAVWIHALLSHDTTAGGQVNLANHSGYFIGQAGDTKLIMDIGGPPPPGFDENAHGGLASFEFSSDGHLVVINSGPDRTLNPVISPIIRGAAAHSTASVDAASPAKFDVFENDNQRVVTRVAQAPSLINGDSWQDTGFSGWRLEHDGYAAQGCNHERGIALSEDGNIINGYDRLREIGGNHSKPGQLDIRFHLHPDIVARKDPSDGSIALWNRHDAKTGWIFSVEAERAIIEDSVRFDGPSGRLATKVITITIGADAMPTVSWQFRRLRA